MNSVKLFGKFFEKTNKYRYSVNQKALLDFAISTDEGYIDSKTGKKKYEYHNCRAWGRLATFINDYFKHGDLILVEGHLHNEIFISGKDKKHMTFVVVDKAEFGGRPDYTSWQKKQDEEVASEKAQQQAMDDERAAYSRNDETEEPDLASDW